MSSAFVPGPPRLVAQYLDDEPIELARGRVSDEDIEELIDQMLEPAADGTLVLRSCWQVWEEIPWDRRDTVDPPHFVPAHVRERKNALQITPEERNRLDVSLRLPFNPTTPIGQTA